MPAGFGDRNYREVESAAAMAGRTWFYDAAHKNLQGARARGGR
jgi:hypothetical protein